MKRREFLRVIGLGSAALVLPGCTGATRSSETVHKKRPNFLFVMSDDHATNAIGCYSSRINKTPNIDRLAKEGMRFDNCFCTNSICVPSRASILTGKYGHKNGCITLDEPFDGRQQTFPKLLQKSGYYTGVIGKWHLFTKPTGFDYYNVLPEQGLYFDPLFKEKGKPWRDGEEGGRVIEGYVTDITADLVLDFLQNRPKDRPFCLLYHNKAPHDLWEYDDKHAHLYEETDIPEPDNLFDDYRNRGRAIRQNTFKIGMEDTIYEEQTGHLRGKRRKQKQYQIFIKSYLRCVASIDDNFGRVLDYLGRWGLADNTIVVYTSDQGFFLGEHGLWDKRMMYEESIRMPLIIRYPKVIEPGSIRDEIVLNVDFAETLLDYAGVDIPKDMQGRSLRPLLEGRTPSNWRESMYYRYWEHGVVAPHFGTRTKRYKLIYYYGLEEIGIEPSEPEWELFDLEKDPQEMNNVYDDPAYAQVVKELKEELLGLKHHFGDTDEPVANRKRI